jgi:membrane protease YdiL (CAAX protease family)
VLFGALVIGDMLARSQLDQARFALGAGWVLSGFAAAGFLIPAIRKDAAAWLPIDPNNPVHCMALMFAVVLLGTNVATFAFTDVFGALMSQPPQQLADVFFGELPLLVIAAAGVGIYIRRSGREALTRLGVVVPSWWHAVLAFAVAGIFLAVLIGIDSANHFLLPSTAERVDAVNTHVFGEIARAGLVGTTLIALLPGICEDLLFRGAVQPRLGLVPTALLFTSIHQQYGLSLDLVGIFIVALALGLIRKYTNTATSILTHVAYNFIGGVLPLAGPWLYAAVGVELVLVAIAAAAIWRRRPVNSVANSRPEG